MKVGYIARCRDENGKETFRYLEANAARRIEVRSDTVKVPFPYGTIQYEEIESNAAIMTGRIVLVNEPFFTDEETKNQA